MSEAITQNVEPEDEEPDDIFGRFTDEEVRDGLRVLRFILVGSDDAASWSPKDVQ